MGLAWKIQHLMESGLPPTREAVLIIGLYTRFIQFDVNVISKAYNTYMNSPLGIYEFVDVMCKVCTHKMEMDEALQVCVNQSRQNAWDAWEMETSEFTNMVQWLPREMMEDTLILL